MIEIGEIIIVAIVISKGEKLITRNVKYFARIQGLEMESY